MQESPLNDSEDRQCPNCGERAVARYCSRCGQDTSREIAKVSSFVVGLISEAVDIRGPFQRTLRSLFGSPGKLAREYSERRFKSQISPIRLYLASAAGFFVLRPLWGQWSERTDLPGGGFVVRNFDIGFASPLVFALLVPIWAGLVQLSLLDRKVFYEEAFAFSAHYHVVVLAFVTVFGGGSSLAFRLNVLNMSNSFLPILVASPLLLLYIFRALREAFGIGLKRAGVMACGLFLLHASAAAVLFQMLAPQS